jgi:hypothetical protein
LPETPLISTIFAPEVFDQLKAITGLENPNSPAQQKVARRKDGKK